MVYQFWCWQNNLVGGWATPLRLFLVIFLFSLAIFLFLIFIFSFIVGWCWQNCRGIADGYLFLILQWILRAFDVSAIDLDNLYRLTEQFGKDFQKYTLIYIYIYILNFFLAICLLFLFWLSQLTCYTHGMIICVMWKRKDLHDMIIAVWCGCARTKLFSCLDCGRNKPKDDKDK